MGRSFLARLAGDANNAVLAAAGAKLRKLLGLLAEGAGRVGGGESRRGGERVVPCRREERVGGAFDFVNMRSGGVVLAELTPVGGLAFQLARVWLRVRRTWRRLTREGPFWSDPWSGERAAAWLKRHHETESHEQR